MGEAYDGMCAGLQRRGHVPFARDIIAARVVMSARHGDERNADASLDNRRTAGVATPVPSAGLQRAVIRAG